MVDRTCRFILSKSKNISSTSIVVEVVLLAVIHGHFEIVSNLHATCVPTANTILDRCD